MTVGVAIGVYIVVHAIGVYLLRASGTWHVLFAPVLALSPDKTPDPLQVAPRGWIENHSFWDLASPPEETHSEDAEQVFWGANKRDAG